LNEVADYYTRGGSDVFIALLDASKAFDRVHYVRLFDLLLQRGLCPLLIKLVLFMYTHQSLSVKWQGMTSPLFDCKNGIKQGAVLSPILICVYMDSLLVRLSQCGLGCYIGHTFIGALSYADDLSLIAPTHYACQKMLAICDEFAEEFNVQFNSTKSVVIVLKTSAATRPSPPLFLAGSPIPYSENAIHLGSHIGSNAHRLNIQKAISDLYSQINMLVSNYSHCHFDTLCSLFKTFCSSFYGCMLWDFSSMELFFTAWRKSVRRLLKLHPMTRSKYLSHILNVPDVNIQLHQRLIRFYSQCLRSRNVVVRTCINIPGTTSFFSKNLAVLCRYINCDFHDVSSMCVNGSLSTLLMSTWVESLNEACMAEASVIVDLCRSRYYPDFFSCVEIEYLLYIICTLR